ncbi:MAG: hypothetical protein ABH872_04870 [Candidatus Omnitrophota bacterium]
MFDFLKSKTSDQSYKQPSLVLSKIIGLESLEPAVNKFYDILPKFLNLQKPQFDKVLQNAIYRISYALMNPKVVEKLRGLLPIERDRADYFFPTQELQDLRNKLTARKDSKTDRDSLVGIMTAMLTQGLDALGKFPVFRYLALEGNLTGNKPLNEIIEGAAQAFSVMAQSPKIVKWYMRESKRQNIEGEIKIYEETVVSKLRISATIIYCLYFDIINLFLGQFNDESIQRAIEEALDDDFPKDSTGGFYPALMSGRVYNVIKQEKINYVKASINETQQRLYAPLALLIFRQNLILESGLKGPAHKSFTKLKSLEFLYYNEAMDYKGYIDCLKHKKNVQSVLSSAIKEITKKKDDPQMVAEYLNLFERPETEDGRVIKMLISEKFINLWGHAYISGWSWQLTSDIRILPEVAADSLLCDLLNKQKTGELVLILRHEGFRNYLKRKSGQEIDFSSLYKIFSKDEKLFVQVYPKLIESDKEFTKALVRLIYRDEFDACGIVLTEKIIKFVKALSDYNGQDAKAIIEVLKYFNKAQLAITYGYAPFSGNLEDMRNKVAFSSWFFENEQVIFKKLTLAEAVSPYLENSNNPELREALIQLLQKHGDEFLSKYVPEFRHFKGSQNLMKYSFLRMVNIFIPLTHARRLCRKREIISILQYMASVSSDSEWKEFSDKFVEINGESMSDYDEFLKKYNAQAILKGMDIKGGMQEIKIIIESFNSVNEDRQKGLLNRLGDFLSRTEVPSEVIKSVCGAIVEGRCDMAEVAIHGLEKGMGHDEIADIINGKK